MKQWLIDTNIVSEIMRRKPDTNVQAWCISKDTFRISVITIDEIIYGLERQSLDSKIKWFQEFVSTKCMVHPVTEPIANRAGEIRGQLASIGQTRSQADMLIAATAWSHNLVLATRNTKDFDGTGVSLFNPFEA